MFYLQKLMIYRFILRTLRIIKISFLNEILHNISSPIKFVFGPILFSVYLARKNGGGLNNKKISPNKELQFDVIEFI